MFCVFEGLDGSGKTTLLNRVAAELQAGTVDWFAKRFSGVDLLKEPTDLPGGRRIREMLSAGPEALPGRLEWLEYFLADRADNVKTHIEPGLVQGRLLLQDRYYWSTAAYQGHPRETPSPKEIVTMNQERGFPSPHVLFYLEFTPERALERARARGPVETFETLEQLRAIYTNYETIIPSTAVRLDAELPTERQLTTVLDAIRTCAAA